MPQLFQAFRSWRQRKEMWEQEISGGGVVGERGKERPLSLSSSFLFYALLLLAALSYLNAWNRLGTPKDILESVQLST